MASAAWPLTGSGWLVGGGASFVAVGGTGTMRLRDSSLWHWSGARALVAQGEILRFAQNDRRVGGMMGGEMTGGRDDTDEGWGE